MVLMSPVFRSPTAIFLSTRLMILPDRVFGRPGASCMKSGLANGPIFLRTANTKNRPSTVEHSNLELDKDNFHTTEIGDCDPEGLELN